MPPFLYRCPFTGLRVEGFDCVRAPEEGEHYTAQSCQACRGVHLVNPRTGKLMSEEHPPPKRT
jgi:hypothetical protein